MSAGRPDAEIEIDERLVQALLSAQHPGLASYPIKHLDAGWDNAMFRLGDEHTVRLPRRSIAARLLVNEQTWLPKLAPSLPIPISVPTRFGKPSSLFPWHWSVLTWLPGQPADLAPIAAHQALRLADFLRKLHRKAPDDAPENNVRGVSIRSRATQVAERLARLRDKTPAITQVINRIWEKGLSAAETSERRWLHGDLHAQNVLVADGTISAVIDWGDITAGDVATDLAGIWLLLDDQTARDRALQSYGPDQPTLERAKAWAVLFAVVLLDSGLINSPRHAASGRQAFLRISEDG